MNLTEILKHSNTITEINNVTDEFDHNRDFSEKEIQYTGK